MDQDGKIDIEDLENKKLELAKLSKIAPADFNMEKFNIDASGG